MALAHVAQRWRRSEGRESAPAGSGDRINAAGGDVSPWRDALAQLERACSLLELDRGIQEMLATPRRVIQVALAIRRDSGQLETFEGYRVQHSLTRGLVLGIPWRHEEHAARLAEQMRRSFTEVTGYADRRGLTLCDAALCLGVGRVVSTHETRGPYP
jgi:glutamate dehydrogenase/leucine dehydrogenase